MSDWWIFKGSGVPHEHIERLPPPPPWRVFADLDEQADRVRADLPPITRREIERGKTYQASYNEAELVNAALYLRRPLLITGKPGSGKSSLAYSVAHELGLGTVLRWFITSKSTLQEGLYRYDAIGRLQQASIETTAPGANEQPSSTSSNIGQFIRLGPLGTALLPARKPRVLLIDEIDKSDIDLPNDLLHVFEEGEFEIPELSRLSEVDRVVSVLPYDANDRISIHGGHVRCVSFPLVILTSNGEREFPPAFLRRCLRIDMQPPDAKKLTSIVQAHLGARAAEKLEGLLESFLARRESGDVAADQLLNAVHLTMQGIDPLTPKNNTLLEALLRRLNEAS